MAHREDFIWKDLETFYEDKMDHDNCDKKIDAPEKVGWCLKNRIQDFEWQEFGIVGAAKVLEARGRAA